jgi:hypothetical protein
MFGLRFFTVIVYLGIGLTLSGCDKQSNSIAIAQVPISDVKETLTPAPEVPRKKNFDINSKNLPIDFVPDSPIATYDAISRLEIPKKDKFESEKEYFSRLKLETSKKIFDDVELGGAFAFMIPPTSFFGQTVSYDPERKGFKIRIPVDHCGVMRIYNCVGLDSRQAAQFEYHGWDKTYELAYNRKITHRKTVDLNISGLKDLIVIEEFYKVGPDQARKLDQNLAVIFTGYLVPPYSGEAETHPREQKTEMIHHRLINFSLFGLWLVNQQTGEILLKVRPRKG